MPGCFYKSARVREWVAFSIESGSVGGCELFFRWCEPGVMGGRDHNGVRCAGGVDSCVFQYVWRGIRGRIWFFFVNYFQKTRDCDDCEYLNRERNPEFWV